MWYKIESQSAFQFQRQIPSGEVFVQMDSEESAYLASYHRHNSDITIGKKKRYIEVFQCSAQELALVLNGMFAPAPLVTAAPATPTTIYAAAPGTNLLPAHFLQGRLAEMSPQFKLPYFPSPVLSPTATAMYPLALPYEYDPTDLQQGLKRTFSTAALGWDHTLLQQAPPRKRPLYSHDLPLGGANLPSPLTLSLTGMNSFDMWNQRSPTVDFANVLAATSASAGLENVLPAVWPVLR